MVPPHICLVEELVSGGSLFDALHRRSRRRGATCASPLAYPRVRALSRVCVCTDGMSACQSSSGPR